MRKVISANLNMLNRCTEILDSLHQELFIKSIPAILNETVGRHFRHIIEFYLALFIVNEKSPLNYDARERNLQLETDVQLAYVKLEMIKNQLSEISTDGYLIIKFNPFSDQDYWETADSTLKRELLYLYDHTVHHLFMIRLAMDHFDITFPEMDDLGINPSTLRNRACVL